MEERWKELQERLERLEQEVLARRRASRTKQWFASALMLAGACFVITRPTATIIKAESTVAGQPGFQIGAPFTVVEAAGKPILRVDAMGSERGLLLLDQAGKIICGIGVSTQSRGMVQGRGLSILDADEKLIGLLGQGRLPDDSLDRRSLVVLDPGEKIISGMGASSRGRGLVVHDQTGAWVVGLGVWPQRPDRGQFVITDRDGHTLFSQPSFP